MKKSLLALLAVVPFCITLCGCESEYEIKLEKTTDNYRTFYQIFPYAFADSNNDGVGDINGITDKLDYIDSLHFDGLWLTPIHQSESYHKYDVDDYKSIDQKFGTLEDYDNLITKAHELGMEVILDLVFNHSSDTHKWFQLCMAAHMGNQTSSKYYNYYNVEKYTPGEVLPSGWSSYKNQLKYEAQFYSGMPDLNLKEVIDHPFGYLASDLKEIVRFWLVDHHVDGFRLDAVTSYFTADSENTTKFLSILNGWVKGFNENAYIVGEGSWGNVGENRKYQSSGIDSLFNFDNARADGYVAQSIIHQDASYLGFADRKNTFAATENGIPAPFVANHDTGRAFGAFYGNSNNNNLKFGYLMLQLLKGSTFHYYGDEAGMAVPMGAMKDEDIRQPMPWGDSYTCKPVFGTTNKPDTEKYKLGTVSEQLKDEDSLINFVKRVNEVRRGFKAISHGSAKEVYLSGDNSKAVYSKTYEDETIYIALNAHKSNEMIYDLKDFKDIEIVGKLNTNGKIKVKGGKLYVPYQSAVVFKVK